MIVVDSSFLIAYHNERDTHHEVAAQLLEPLLAGEWGSALLPEYVFLEVTTVLAMRRDLDTAVRVGEILLQSQELELVPTSPFFLDSLRTFRRQPRGELSFVHCAIIAIAHERNARFVLTFDAGFRQVEDLQAIPE